MNFTEIKMNIVSWIKQNKFTTVLLLIAAYFAFQFFTSTVGVSMNDLAMDSRSGSSTFGTSSSSFQSLGKVGAPMAESTRTSGIVPPVDNYAPQPDVSNRLVVTDSYMSLLVSNVTEVRGKIVNYAETNGGYMVNSNVNNPQDAPTATVIVRVPSKKIDDALSFYRGLGIKVVNENLNGTDVTDQYVDIDTRIKQLETTKAKLEELLDKATLIADITNLTQQILSYQNQIDSYKGQQDALKKNADLAKLTIYLSTDEIALPYTPTETFRPGVIFKLAVRSLVTSLRGIATNLIWLGVYAVIWLPVLIGYILIRKWWLRRNKTQSSTSYKN
jgi:hypothetical protein